MTLLAEVKVIESSTSWEEAAARKFRAPKSEKVEPYINGRWSVFSLPMDANALYELAEAKRLQAEHELNMLQLDPMSVHRKIRNAQSLKAMTRSPKPEQWTTMAILVYQTAFERYRMWQAITLRLKELVNVSTEPLPVPLAVADLISRRVNFTRQARTLTVVRSRWCVSSSVGSQRLCAKKSPGRCSRISLTSPCLSQITSTPGVRSSQTPTFRVSRASTTINVSF